MSIKVRKKRGEHSDNSARRRKKRGDDYIEVGHGDYCVVTINRHDGSTVVQRFTSEEEAQAQHNRNIRADKPLVGVTELN